MSADPFTATGLPGSSPSPQAQSLPQDLFVSPRDLRAADPFRLKALLAQLRASLEACARTVDELHRTAKRQRQRTHQDPQPVDDAFAQVRARETALRWSILAANTAVPRDAPAAQARVAADYEAYARAVTVAEAAARTSHTALATARNPAR